MTANAPLKGVIDVSGEPGATVATPSVMFLDEVLAMSRVAIQDHGFAAEWNANMKLLKHVCALDAEVAELKVTVAMLKLKLDMLWNAPGMPGYKLAHEDFSAVAEATKDE